MVRTRHVDVLKRVKHLYEGCYMSLANPALSYTVTLGRVVIEVLHVHHDHVHHVGDV